MTTINVTNDNSNSYQINGESNPTISLVRGNTYYLVINASGHPFQIRNGNTPLGDSDGVTNNGASVGTITYVVPSNAPNTLSYSCTVHSNMTGTINITDAATPTLQPGSIFFNNIISSSNDVRRYIFNPTPNSNLTLTGQFTLEWWFYSEPGVQTGLFPIMLATNKPWGNGCFEIVASHNNNGTFGIAVGSYGDVYNTNVNIMNSTWNNCAITRNSSNLVSLWVNGVSYSTFTNSETWDFKSFSVGTNPSDGNPNLNLVGYISNLRILNGTCLYTSTYSVPTEQYTSITNTVLLMNTYFNTPLLDSSPSNITVSYSSNPPAASSSAIIYTTILSEFTIEPKTVSDSSFNITAPTSNRVGAFTYTSSNTAVATISGTTVTIVGAGTSTITATQAATSTYTSGTITATLQVTLTTTTLSEFTIEPKTVSDSSFNITAPTTNSNGAFTYTSSNTAVATISGTTVTIVGAGTSTITATQAATSTHTSGTITATLTINKSTICLTNPSIIKIVASNGNKYVFNNSTTYDSNIVYGLGIGTYVFKDIPQAHPMALLNNGKTNSITYSGDSSKKLTGQGSYPSYDFYYGDITVQVLGDFGTLSIYCYYHGYMGGENLLKYSSSCLITQPPIFSPISMSSLFTNNAQIFYKSHSLSTGGGGSGVRNSRHKQRRT